MKKIILIMLAIMVMGSSVILANDDFSLTAENTIGFQLPSDLDTENAGILSNVIKISAEIKEEYTVEFNLPLNLIVHSLIGESDKEAIFFLGSPQISVGLILNRDKQINHSINLNYGIPVKVSNIAAGYVEKDLFHRLSVSYRLGYVSDPVVFYTGLQIESSIPFREDGALHYDLPTITLPLDFIFSINRVFSAKTSIQMKADLPVLIDGNPAESQILYSLSGNCELIANIGKSFIRFGISKSLSSSFSSPMVYVSFLRQF